MRFVWPAASRGYPEAWGGVKGRALKGVKGRCSEQRGWRKASGPVCQGESSGLWLWGSGLGLWLPVHLRLPCVPVSVQRRDRGGPPSATLAGGGELTHQAPRANARSYLGCTQAGKGVAASGVLSSAASGEARSFLEADQHGPPVTSPLSGASTLVSQCLSHAGG